MKKIIFQILFCLIFCNLLSAQKLEITKLTGNFYVFTTYQDYKGTPFPSNGMYAVTREGVIMIDSPWDTTQVLPLLDSIQKKHGKKVSLCIATHYHDDRTGGFDILKRNGVKTYSSRQTWDLCKEKGEKQAEFIFNRDTVFSIGDVLLQTYYPGHGHTQDNIVIWFPKEKVLYGGCFVKSAESKSLGNIADASIPEWSIAVKKVMKKFSEPKFIVPGHQDWRIGNALKHTEKLLEEEGRK